MGGQRIPSGTVTLVESGQMMRFGDVEARFLLAEALRPEAPAAAAMADAGEEQTIGVALTSPGAAVSAGSPTTATAWCRTAALLWTSSLSRLWACQKDGPA